LVLSLEAAEEKNENYRREYNHYRPHSTLDDLTSKEFFNFPQMTSEILFATV